METGTLIMWDPVRVFGFVRPDAGGVNVFVHRSAFVDRLPADEGERVVFFPAVRDRGVYAQWADLVDADAGGAE